MWPMEHWKKFISNIQGTHNFNFHFNHNEAPIENCLVVAFSLCFYCFRRTQKRELRNTRHSIETGDSGNKLEMWNCQTNKIRRHFQHVSSMIPWGVRKYDCWTINGIMQKNTDCQCVCVCRYDVWRKEFHNQTNSSENLK